MAKTSILTILIQLAKQGNADRETVKGLAQMKGGVTQAMGVFAALAGVAYTVNKALDATVGTFVNYAAQVREMSRLTGTGAEETSKLIQMADDLTISYESLQKSLWFASKNGIEVNVDSLASLADQYMALNSPMARADFLAKNFGKSGMDMAKMLEQGGAAVRDLAGSIEGSLVLTDQAVQDAREYEMALEEMNEQVEEAKVGIGQKLVPALTDLLFVWNNSARIIEVRNQLMKDGIATEILLATRMATTIVQTEQATSAIEDQSAALAGLEPSAQEAAAALEEAAAAADEMSRKNQDLLSVMLTMQGEYDRYNEDLLALTEKMTALKDEQALYLEGGAKYRELQGEIEKTGLAIDDLAAQHEMAGKRIAFSMLQQQLASDGLTTEELMNLQQVGLQWGILSEEVVIATNQAVENIKAMTDETSRSKHEAKELMTRWEKMLELSGTAVDFFVNIHTSGSMPRLFAGGGGSGGELHPNQAMMVAEGGQLGNGWAVVGEEGFEIISPTGYVFPHDVSKQLVAGGIVPDVGMAVGGYWDDGEYFSFGSAGSTGFGSPTRGSVATVGGRQFSDYSNTRTRQDRGELSGVSTSEAVASAVVSEAVTPLVQSTADAVQSASVARQVTVDAITSMTNAQAETNDLMAGIREDLQRNNVTTRAAIVAAIQQVIG